MGDASLPVLQEECVSQLPSITLAPFSVLLFLTSLLHSFAKYNDKHTTQLLHKLLQTSGDHEALVLNGSQLVSLTQSAPSVKTSSIPLLSHITRKYTAASLAQSAHASQHSSSRPSTPAPASTTPTHVSDPTKPFGIETTLGWLDEDDLIALTNSFETILIRTPAQASRDPNATNLFSALTGPARPSTTAMNDVDGQPSRAFFSALLDTSYLSEDQVSHHSLLLSLSTLLNHLYKPLASVEYGHVSNKFQAALATFLDAIYKYIARVMDQIKFCQQLELKALTGVSATDPNAFFQLPAGGDLKELRESRLSRGTKYPDLLLSTCLSIIGSLCHLEPARIESCWILLSRSCLAMSGVESNFSKFLVPKKDEGADSSDPKHSSFGRGPLHSQSASFLSNWHSSLGVPAGLILGFSTAFFYPATCSALFFAPNSLLNFGTSPERLHTNSALQVLSFVMDNLLFSKNVASPALYDIYCAHNGILPFSIEFIFRSYFDSFLSLYYQDPIVAHDTFKWIQKYAPYINGSALDNAGKFVPALRLSTHINMHGQHLTFFECFYKILFKMVAWHGMSVKTLFEEGVIPAVLTPSIHLELFHTLVDLPLLTVCMEMVEPEVKLIITSTGAGGFSALATASSLLTSVIFSVHQQQAQSQHHQALQQQAQAMHFPADGSMPSFFGGAPGSASPSPYGSGKFSGIPGQSGSMTFGGDGMPQGGGASQGSSLLAPSGIHIDKHRSILNIFLWNEGGVVGNLWDSTNPSRSGSASSDRYTTPSIAPDSLLAGFWNDCKITPRVLSAAEITISSLDVLLKLIIERSTIVQLQELVMNLLDRMEKSFPLNTFQAAVQTTLTNSLAACFEKFPALVVRLQRPLIDLISAGDVNGTKIAPLSKTSGGSTWRDELTNCLVWIIGKYASPNIAGETCTYQVMSDFDEALELLAYEKISILSMEIAESQHVATFGKSASQASLSTVSASASSKRAPMNWKEYKKSKTGKRTASLGAGATSSASSASNVTPALVPLSPTSRLLLVLCASLTKLAARCLPLASRVKLCLAKILRHPPSQPPPTPVLRWAHHCLNILKYPSLAAHILDAYSPSLSDENATANESGNASFENSRQGSLPKTPWQHLDSEAREPSSSEDVHAVLQKAKSSAVDGTVGDLARKEFSDNPSVDLASVSSFGIDQQTSLSFLLHRIDHNLRMTHDGSLDLKLFDDAAERHLPDDLTAPLVPSSSIGTRQVTDTITISHTGESGSTSEKKNHEKWGSPAARSSAEPPKMHPFVL